MFSTITRSTRRRAKERIRSGRSCSRSTSKSILSRTCIVLTTRTEIDSSSGGSSIRISVRMSFFIICWRGHTRARTWSMRSITRRRLDHFPKLCRITQTTRSLVGKTLLSTRRWSSSSLLSSCRDEICSPLSKSSCHGWIAVLRCRSRRSGRHSG